jgi:hypothetical protein
MKVAILLLSLSAATVAGGGTPERTDCWRYTLLEGSTLTDDCPVCGRPTIILPMRGSFSLRLLDDNGLFATYALGDISFTAGGGPTMAYQVTGSGTLQIGGEVALTQEGSMQVEIDNGFVKTDAQLAGPRGPLGRRWPMIQISLRQTNGTVVQVYDLTLAAAPMREAWFSTAGEFTSSTRPPLDSHVSGGDLLSSSGRIVRRNRELTRRLGIMPIVPDLGLDALDLRAGGEIVFSLETSVFSETLGPLQAGDCLSDGGSIVTTNQALLGRFGVQPPSPDAGLDAVQFFDTAIPGANVTAGEVWFSLRDDQFSEELGVQLRAGDLLSSLGRIVLTNGQLVEPFHPNDPKVDVGLDALYVWPSGEIWFSTESGFMGEGSIPYLGGDVLSDQGYVVFRNLELLDPFAPIEDRAEFGLDALWIVSDAAASAAPLRIDAITGERATGDVRLQWQGGGRAFQVEGTPDLASPWVPISPIFPGREFIDVGALPRQRRGFYRIRQW